MAKRAFDEIKAIEVVAAEIISTAQQTVGETLRQAELEAESYGKQAILQAQTAKQQALQSAKEQANAATTVHQRETEEVCAMLHRQLQQKREQAVQAVFDMII
ncbi:MAG: hypothetical protein FWB93_04800 [Oscillospiraceae bacterium]|nr:hypothetical protein [Oscillospiraceae bacterium]